MAKRGKARCMFLALFKEIQSFYFQGYTAKETQKLVHLDTEMSYAAFCDNLRKYVKVSKRAHDIKLSANLLRASLEDKTEPTEQNHSDQKELATLRKENLQLQKELYKLRYSQVERTEQDGKNYSSVEELTYLLNKLLDQQLARKTNFEPQENEKTSTVRKHEPVDVSKMTSDQKLELADSMSPKEKFHFRRHYLNHDEELDMLKRMSFYDVDEYIKVLSVFNIEQRKRQRAAKDAT